MYTNFDIMATVYTVLRKEKTTNDQQAIYLCVTIGKDRKYYSLKKFVAPNFWDPKAHRVKPKEGNALFLNNLITQKETEVMNIFQHFHFEGKLDIPGKLTT